MNYRRFLATMRGCARRWLPLPLLILSAVSLTACSTGYEALEQAAFWAEKGKVQQAKADKVVASAEPAPKAAPDIPPQIAVCLKHGAARARVEAKKRLAVQGKGPAPTADEMVAAKLQTEDERNACTAKLMEWYREQQKIRKEREKASAKVAAVAK